MTRNKLILAATSALVGVSALTGSLAYASGNDTPEALQAFLADNPAVAEVVADVEAQTGGTVTGAEYSDDTPGDGIVEFEIMMADGSELDMLYTLADGTMVAEVDEDDDEDEEDEDDEDDDDDDGDDDDDDDDEEEEDDD